MHSVQAWGRTPCTRARGHIPCTYTSCTLNKWPVWCYRAGMAVKTVGVGVGVGVGLEERWRDILSVHARTMCEIDRVLHPHGLGASDFEVLDILATESPEDGDQCRVQNLVGRVHLSQSALSRLIGR